MRKPTLLLLAMAVAWDAAGSTDADSTLRSAEKAYMAGDHASALAAYTDLQAQGISSDLYYNIANCHYKLGDVAMATLYYERALKLAPGDEDIRANLELARSRSKDRVNELPGSTLLTQWNRLAGGRDPDHWARRSLGSVALLFILLAATLFMGPSALRRWTRISAAGVALFAVLAFSMAATRHAAINDTNDAIVMTAKVDVRSEPRADGTVLFVIHKGTKVRVLERNGTWCEIRLANGTVGWMPHEGLTLI